MERMLMDCCVGCRNYQKCRVCRFEDDVACTKYKVEWLFWRIGATFCRIGKTFGKIFRRK